MTIDDLAVLIQGEFRVMRSELATKDELKYEAGLLATKEDLKNLEKRTSSLEEKIHNGFYNVSLELKEIRMLIKKVDTREQVINLEARMDVVEHKLDMNKR